MTEILTESFCERCGTRYTFESSAPRKSRIGRVRMAAKGVKNFVMSDEASFSEAMADARGEEELAATAHQLDAFHKTFNFCLTCRQYTCGDCWNPGEGRCLTCAPMAGIAEPEYAPAPHGRRSRGADQRLPRGRAARVLARGRPDAGPAGPRARHGCGVRGRRGG